MSDEKNNEMINNAINSVEKLINNKISLENVLSVCIGLMQFAEKIPNMKGPQKKNLVISAMEAIITKFNGENSLLLVLPFFIDKIIDVENGNLHVSISQSCCSQLSCFSFCKKKN